MLQERSVTRFEGHCILYSQGEMDGRDWGQEGVCSLPFCSSKTAAAAAGGPWGQEKDGQPSGVFTP